MSQRCMAAAVLGLSLVLCLVIAELSSRVFYLMHPNWRDDPRSKFLVPNSEFSHWHPAAFSGRSASEHGEFDVVFSTNTIGMVDKERTITPRPPLRIALLGDSFVEGVQVEMGERFSERLEQKLNSDNNRVEVLNFGCSWYSPLLELSLYRHLVREFDPDLVLLFVHFTDVTDDWRFRTQAIRGPEGELERVDSSPLLSGLRSRPGRWLWRSALLRWTYRTWQRYAGVNVRGDTLKESFAAWFSRELTQSDQEAIDYTETNIAAIARAVDDAGSRLVIVGVPIAQTVTMETAHDRFVRASLEPDGPRHAMRFYAWLRQLASRTGVQYVDLLPAFQAERGADPLFYPRDGHFTRLGHAVVSERLAELLSR
jgi:lysophospholipase L1-like esterase